MQSTSSNDPTIRQLANFACVMTHGYIVPWFRDLIEAMFYEHPSLREEWVRNHEYFQERINGIAQEDDNV